MLEVRLEAKVGSEGWRRGHVPRSRDHGITNSLKAFLKEIKVLG